MTHFVFDLLPINFSTSFSSKKPVEIDAVQYDLLSTEEIHKMSVLSCRRVIPPAKEYGVNDARLGVCDRASTCATCRKKGSECIGHPGHIDLEVPVFHLGFFPAVLRICRTICKRCSHVLLTEEEKEYYTKRLKSKKLDPLQQGMIIKAIQLDAYKTRVCLHCGGLNGAVRRLRPLRIVHEKYKVDLRKGESSVENADLDLNSQLQAACRFNKEIEACKPYVQEFLDPILVRRLFQAIPVSEHILLGFQPGTSPVSLIISTLLVPPVCVRPRVVSANKVREDDLTAQYTDILFSSDSLKEGALDAAKYVENWEMLQARVARLIDSSMPGFAPQLRMLDAKSYAQRLKGKHGRFRGNLSGKRVDFSGRSVISPDPNLDIDELAVPLRVARELTYPQRVFSANLELMRRLVRNGPRVHPGAVTVYLSKEGSRRSLHHSRDREALAARLSVGDIVERHILNGDMILFNRQPSLHRISMMAHRARVLPYRTFRFNECCCAPYNADFDGDEMNVHFVQTEAARAEAKILMSSAKNIITAKNGEPIIACTQDFLTASYLLTSKDTFFDRSQFSLLISHWLGSRTTFEMPIPSILKPVELWTGKQIFELIVQPSQETSPVLLNLEASAKFYTGKNAHDCPQEGFVSFLDSKFISGRLDKKLLGGGAKDGLFARLYALAGGEYTAQCMARIAQCTSRYLMNYGFSLGLGDVAPTPSLNKKKRMVLSKSFATCDRLIHLANTGRMEPLPGLSIKQSLEAKLNAELSKVRDACGSAAVETLDGNASPPLIMVQSGSKGSALNTAQMMACVGQQTVSGKRIQNSFQDRSLPHFLRFSEDPASRGFVASSFYSGLSPTEFFFHTMAGREGLVDTAVKTAETGYIYRRLMKAMENLSVKYDQTVRNTKGDIIQLMYGEDGLDPWMMEGANGAPLNFNQEWLMVRAQYSRAARERTSFARSLQKQHHWNQSLTRLSPQHIDHVTNLSSNTILEKGPSLMDHSSYLEWHSLSLLPSDIVPFVSACLDGDESLLSMISAHEYHERSEEESLLSLYAVGSPPSTTSPKKNLRTKNAHSSLFNGASAALRQFSLVRSEKFKQDVLRFFGQKIKEQEKLRQLLDLPLDSRPDLHTISDELAFRESLQTEILPLSKGFIVFFFLFNCVKKYIKKKCEPGTPCGAIAAQSVGEPSTQMTLRTFHFAGVASMSITQGVPRLVEIINANKNIATPVVTAPLCLESKDFVEYFLRQQRKRQGRGEGEMRSSPKEEIHLYGTESDSLKSKQNADNPAPALDSKTIRDIGRLVKAHLECLQLKEIATDIVEVVTARSFYLQIYLNMPLIEKLLLPVDATVVKEKILNFASRPMSPLRKLTASHIKVVGKDSLIINPTETRPEWMHYNLQNIYFLLPNIVVNGVSDIHRVMFSPDGKELLAEGTALSKTFIFPFIDFHKTTCNHVAVAEKTLGIEAARTVIINEIMSILKAYSLSIDLRHIYLLSDLMTHKGSVLGITRYGIQKMSHNVLTMASFERTTEHLFNAALSQRKDTFLSISESIILGKPVPLGSYACDLLLENDYQRSHKSSNKVQLAEKFDMKAKKSTHAMEELYKENLPYTNRQRLFSPLAAEKSFHLDLF